MWIVKQKEKENGKWRTVVENIPDEITADEWIQMLQRHHVNDEFKKERVA